VSKSQNDLSDPECRARCLWDGGGISPKNSEVFGNLPHPESFNDRSKNDGLTACGTTRKGREQAIFSLMSRNKYPSSRRNRVS
jgi:hypothetical protein